MKIANYYIVYQKTNIISHINYTSILKKKRKILVQKRAQQDKKEMSAETLRVQAERIMYAEVWLASGPHKLKTGRGATMWYYWNICLSFFFLKEILNLQQNWAECRDVMPPAVLCCIVVPTPPTPQALRACRSPTILSAFSVSVAMGESTWTHDHQSPLCTLGVTPGDVQTMGFDTCMSPQMYHTEQFHCLKNPLCSNYLSPPPCQSCYKPLATHFHPFYGLPFPVCP